MSTTGAKEPEQVKRQRGGSVLGKRTILKSDHFPGCQNKRLSPHIDGAPNYRQAESLHVHGVAIPTADGIRNVLDHIGAQNDGKQTLVLWINLREEPVLYINGRPFVLRDVEKPFSNLEYTGINRHRVEQMESRLKEDVLEEAARFGNKILVTDELPDGQMVDQWEPVSCDSVKTPLEVYEELQADGYLVDYERVPVTDEKSPKELDFDILVHKISQAAISTQVIFNCQMGRGRTTTGMVIATLIYLNRIGASGIPRSNSIGRIYDAAADVTDSLPNSEEAIRRGEYGVIRSLIRVLEGGVEGKRQVDKVIDKCASMQNLREAIGTYRNSILRQPDEMKREALLSFFVEYLERYYFLICFAVYIHSERASLRSASVNHISFADWMKARPELYSIIRRLLRRDPTGALGYTSSKPSLMKAKSADGRPSEMGVVAALRNGEVLGSQTVLKSDHCPGCQNQNLPERVDGAPNFREVPGFPVYGVANPTTDGIRSVIKRIGSSKSGRPVFWHNMREEPVIYINGKPFVLREVERPYKNMLEYTGIDRERVESMESRLKEDILREAGRYGGAIMVTHETDDGQIYDAWEHVSPSAVQTPLEVYQQLDGEGYPIKYARVPITDGKAPKSSDFDILALNIASASKDTAFVFNCQMGRGRTTTGTVIACLVKLRIEYGRPIRLLLVDRVHEEADSGFSSGEETGVSCTSGLKEVSSEKQQSHVFGINDILLLWKITTLFDNGVECREALDAVIDRCAALQNIREAVLQYRKMFNQQHVEPRVRRVALNRGAEYLERYFRLIAFAAYLGSEAFDGFCGQGKSRMTFKNWLHQRPEVQAMKWSIRIRPGRFFTVPEELRAPQESQHGDAVMESIVKTRNGSVLGKGSILKMYFFPGQRTSSHIQIHGVPLPFSHSHSQKPSISLSKSKLSSNTAFQPSLSETVLGMAYFQSSRNALRHVIKESRCSSADRLVNPLMYACQGIRYRKLEVILTTSIDKLGKAGETVKVAPGYFRNHLMPKLLAVPNIDKYAYLIKEQRKIYQPKEEEVVKVVKETKEDKNKEYQTAAKRLENSRLVLRELINKEQFRSRATKDEPVEVREPVTKEKIVAEVARQLCIRIEPDNLNLTSPLTTLGEYEVPLHLPKSIPLPEGKVQWTLKVKVRST